MENISIEDRKNVFITGATKVLASTETQATVEMADSKLVISGTNLELTKLDLDNKVVSFCGNINAIKYINKSEKTNLIKRLFK